MHRQIVNVILVVWLCLPAVPVLAASEAGEREPQSPAGEDIENIVVTGQQPGALRQLMLDFIVEIGDPVSSARGYARWRDAVCVGVYNLPDPRAAQYIADKISLIALETGLKTGSPGCQPNLHIVFSPDARALAGSMVEASPLVFHPFGNTEYTTQGAMALEQFKTSDAPVRWWQITMVVDEQGYPAIQLPGMGIEIPISRGEVSRLKSGVNDALLAGLILVDAGKLKGVKWPQLTEYLAMVALAQVKPDALPSGYDSILNLFNADNPPRGMTDMDRSYLRALYEMDTMMLPNTQRGVFSNSMLREMQDEK